MKPIKFFSISLFIGISLSSFSQEYLEVEVSASRLKHDVYFLASDSLAGRRFPYKGREIAAEFIASEFERIGLSPIAEGDTPYYQAIPVRHVQKGRTYLWKDEHGFPSGFRYSFASNYAFNDSINQTVRYWGKIHPSDVNSGNAIPHIYEKNIEEALDVIWAANFESDGSLFVLSLPTKRTRQLRGREWSNTGYIYPNTMRKTLGDSRWLYDYLKEFDDSLSVILVTKPFFEYKYGMSVRKANRVARRSAKGRAEPLETNIVFTSNFEVSETIVNDENVIGYLEGTDLKEEVIIICGHYDHMGRQPSGMLLGADDNASGTAGVMELARMCAQAKAQGFEFRRTLVFVAFAAEEQGLNGSMYYMENPVFPLEKTAKVINMDMIGRSDRPPHLPGFAYMWPIGDNKRTTRKAIRTIDKQLDDIHLYTRKKFPENLMWYFGSDHYPFVKRGIPALVISTGTHDDYHKATDTAEKLNYDNMANILKALFALLTDIANNPETYPLSELKN